MNHLSHLCSLKFKFLAQVMGLILINTLALASVEETLTPREDYIKKAALQALKLDAKSPVEMKKLLDRYLDRQDQITPVADWRANCRLSYPEYSIHQKTLYASESAYDGSSTKNELVPPLGYRLESVFRDQTGMVVTKFSNITDPNLVIYASAGTLIFSNFDIRSIISGLTLAQVNSSGPGAQDVILSATVDLMEGRRVIFTGQSQGSVVSQSLAYFTQLNVNRLRARGVIIMNNPELIVWGVIGAKETISRLLREIRGRGHFARDLEYSDAVARQIHGIGYSFPDDFFARFGTFIGQVYVIPSKYRATPGELSYAESLGFKRDSKFAQSLEGHFLTGFKRASRKGGLCDAEPTTITTWPKLTRAFASADFLARSVIAIIAPGATRVRFAKMQEVCGKDPEPECQLANLLRQEQPREDTSNAFFSFDPFISN